MKVYWELWECFSCREKVLLKKPCGMVAGPQKEAASAAAGRAGGSVWQRGISRARLTSRSAWMHGGGTPRVPGTASSWDGIWEAKAEGWFAAMDGEGCVQPSVLARQGVGAGGSAAGERRAHSCQQGRKSRCISVRLKGRGSTFFDVANVS